MLRGLGIKHDTVIEHSVMALQAEDKSLSITSQVPTALRAVIKVQNKQRKWLMLGICV